MSDDGNSAPAPEDGLLQFDRAEIAGPASIDCSGCRRSIADRYWTLNNKHLCDQCQRSVERHFRGSVAWRTWLSVLGRGGGAALLGTAVYFMVLKITGYELGLIAVGVGLFVGRAVHKASGGRGGWKFQLAAMALTYSSIVASYMPTVYQTLKQSAAKKTSDAQATAADSSTDRAGSHGLSDAPGKADARKPDFYTNHPVLALGLFVVILFGFAALAPLLGGFQNFMGWIIIGIALYEAWKINRRVPLSFSGPFPVPASSAQPPVEVPVSG